ncbi:MAG TPA: class II aldolase/adducin family protein [Trebonia sp.]|nr:class II aldolase/adducin family protein [Trebonia sp.]
MSDVSEAEARAAIVAVGRRLDRAGLAHATSGNISVRMGDGILVTPTSSRLGELEPGDIARLGADGTRISGGAPSKEAGMHRGIYRARPQETAVVHLHALYSTALSCLADTDRAAALPPITGYSLMRLGTVPVVPFFPPGSADLAGAVTAAAAGCRAMLLANHGSVVAGTSLDAAAADAEELEQTARLCLLLRDLPVRMVPAEYVPVLSPSRDLREGRM